MTDIDLRSLPFAIESAVVWRASRRIATLACRLPEAQGPFDYVRANLSSPAAALQGM